MKFKILKGTTLFTVLSAVNVEMKRCNDMAHALTKELGADGHSSNNTGSLIAGSIPAFHFKDPSKRPEGWKAMEKGYTNWFFPKVALKDLCSRIYALPTVSYEAISGPLNYETQSFENNGGLAFSTRPGVFWFDDYILVDVHINATYSPVPDMIEIFDSEFKELRNRLDKQPA